MTNKEKALDMKAKGYTDGEIGLALGITRQRAYVLTAAPKVVRDYIIDRDGPNCAACGIRVGTRGRIGTLGQMEDDYSKIDSLMLLCQTCYNAYKERLKKKLARKGHKNEPQL